MSVTQDRENWESFHRYSKSHSMPAGHFARHQERDTLALPVPKMGMFQNKRLLLFKCDLSLSLSLSQSR